MKIEEILEVMGINTYNKNTLNLNCLKPATVYDTWNENVKLVDNNGDLKIMILQDLDLDNLDEIQAYLRNMLEDKVRYADQIVDQVRRAKIEAEMYEAARENDDIQAGMKYHALLLFRRKKEIMDCDTPEEGEQWTCSEPRIYEDYSACLMAYADTPCPASQMVHANTREDLDKEIAKMKANYHDEEWLENNLYPYL